MNAPQTSQSVFSALRPRAITVALAASALTILISCPTTVHATPSKDFVSDVTQGYFDAVRIIYAEEGDRERSRDNHGDHHEDNGAQIRIVVKDPSDYYIVANTVATGGYSGWHTHPGPSIVLVKSGVATVYDGDDPSCTPKTYPAGSGFVDPGDGHIHMVRNEGAAVLITQAFQIIPTGQARRIDAPSPGNCPF